MLRPLLAPVLSPLVTYGLTPRKGGGFSPLQLFANGEPGAWFDPSDLSSMYQGRTGTTAAVVGSPVGQLLDKSGNSNHAIAPSDAARPILRQSGSLYYLEFDGVDDTLIVSSGALVYGPAEVWAAFRVTGGNTTYGPVFRNNGGGGGQNRFALAHDLVDFGATFLTNGPKTAVDFVCGGYVEGTGTTTQGYYKSGFGTVTGAVTRAGVEGELRLMSAFSDFTAGRFYGGFAIMRNLIEPERTKTKVYYANRAGVTL